MLPRVTMLPLLLFTVCAALAADVPKPKSREVVMNYYVQNMHIVQNIKSKGDQSPGGVPGVPGSPDLRGKLERLAMMLTAQVNATFNRGLKELEKFDSLISENFQSLLRTLQQDFNERRAVNNATKGMIQDLAEYMKLVIKKQEEIKEEIAKNSGIQELNNTLRKLDDRVTEYHDKKPIDCQEAYEKGSRTSGVYVIKPAGSDTSTSVYCEMGSTVWTYLLRRFNGSVNFNQTWDKYKWGFGSPAGEFWLGNEYMYRLTQANRYKLRIDFTEWSSGRARYVEHPSFTVGSEATNYTLTVSSGSGTADKLLERHSNKQFGTPDYNPRRGSNNCANKYHAGWWYHSTCHHVLLTGLYRQSCSSRPYCMGWPYSRSLRSANMRITRAGLLFSNSQDLKNL